MNLSFSDIVNKYVEPLYLNYLQIPSSTWKDGKEKEMEERYLLSSYLKRALICPLSLIFSSLNIQSSFNCSTHKMVSQLLKGNQKIILLNEKNGIWERQRPRCHHCCYLSFWLLLEAGGKKTTLKGTKNYEIMTSVAGYIKIQLMKLFTKLK